MKRIFIIILTSVLILSLCACGEKNPADMIVGTWELDNYDESVALIPWNGRAEDYFDELTFFPSEINFYNDGTFSAVVVTGITEEGSSDVRKVTADGKYYLLEGGDWLRIVTNSHTWEHDDYEGVHGISLSNKELIIAGSFEKFNFIYKKK